MGRVYNVSPHLLMDVLTCATRGHTRHVLGYTSINDAIKAKAGQAFHVATAYYLDPDIRIDETSSSTRCDNAVGALHNIYDPTWATIPAESMEPSLTPENIERVFRRWMDLHPPTAMPWRRVMEVETAFVSRQWLVDGDALIELSINDPAHLAFDAREHNYDIVQLIIRPDAVVEDTAGLYRYVDTKTTGWNITDPTWSRGMRLSLQTQLYADGMMQKYGDKAVLGGWINAVELKKLPGSREPKVKADGTPGKARLCKDHNVPYAECGNEHAKSAMLECFTNQQMVEAAVREAKRAALRFVKLMQIHEQHVAEANRIAVDPYAFDMYPISSIPMEGIATGGCRFCPAVQWCDESSRNVAAINSFMEYSPWPIEIGKRL